MNLLDMDQPAAVSTPAIMPAGGGTSEVNLMDDLFSGGPTTQTPP